MNVLELIRNQILKEQRLEDAQTLMAKAYRGVAHVDAHHDAPKTPGDAPRTLTDRGRHTSHPQAG